ncbi:hypothetical protein [Natrinema sp. SYSU A 869]|uniref:hypothetical protein n=1 Tax=Natrinema sp. SYSU A 869 TaxID=2871694 RepID=UPI001CA3A683|nr:hypothetical protein [Natrinema sp. SYSU A 869]
MIGTSGAVSAASDDASILVDPDQPVIGEETSFTSSVAFAEYEWAIVGPSGFELYTGRTVSTTFEEAGEYTAHLTINQSDGESTYVTTSGQVLESRDVDPTATIKFSPQDPVYNPIMFDASGSTTPAGEIESYDWYWQNVSYTPDEPVFDGSPNGSGETFEQGFSTGTTFKVGLEVTNTAGNTDQATVKFTPEENPNTPSAEVLIDGEENEYLPSNPVEFDASGSTSPNGSIVEYNWKITTVDTDETYHESGEVVTKQLEPEVQHRVQLTVVDEVGKEDTELGPTFWPDADNVPEQ